MKRIALILTVSIILGLFAFTPMSIYASVTEGYITIDSSGRITDCSEDATGDIVIPSKIGGYKVIGFQSESFKNCTKIESITMPDTVTYIASKAFYNCTSLKEVVVSDNVNYINQSAFLGCTSLETITLPFIGHYNPTSANYDKYTFLGYIFGCLSYTNNATSVPASLKKVILSEACTVIEPYAFYGCSGIEEIVIPDTVTSIGNDAFRNSGLVEIDFPASVSSVPTRAFLNCENLKTVNIAQGVEKILGQAFQDCYSIENINIPKSVTSVFSGCFDNCKALKNINVDSENIYYTSFDGVLFNKSVTELHTYPCGRDGSYTVPDGVTKIYGSAFYHNDGISEVNLPDSLVDIGIISFEYCTALKSISIPKNVTNIGNSAFRYCTALESIVFENSEAVVNDYAFAGCSSLSQLDLGDSIETVGNHSFNTGGAKGITELVLPDSLISIGDYSFNISVNLEKLTIGTGLKTIGKYAFGGNINYVNIKDIAAWCDVDMPYDTNPLINSEKLYLNGEIVKNLHIPEGVEIIKYNVFNGIKELDNVYLPKSLTKIEAVNFDTSVINENVYYAGSKSQWDGIEIISYNDKLTSSNIIFEECNCGGKYGEWISNVNPTYIKSGQNIRKCALCDDEQKQVIKATGVVVVGDIDGDENIGALDLTELRFLILNGTDNKLIFDAADADGSSKLDICDLVRLKKYIAKFDVKLG